MDVRRSRATTSVAGQRPLSARLSYGCRSTRGGPTMAERAMPSFKGSPPELTEPFATALARYPDAQRKQMFGYPAAFVGGNHATGLFHDRWVVRLPEDGVRVRTGASAHSVVADRAV